MENPATIASPEVGSSSPQSMRIVVVFPAPFAPKNPYISPFSTSKDMESTATKSPKVFCRFFALTLCCMELLVLCSLFSVLCSLFSVLCSLFETKQRTKNTEQRTQNIEQSLRLYPLHKNILHARRYAPHRNLAAYPAAKIVSCGIVGKYHMEPLSQLLPVLNIFAVFYGFQYQMFFAFACHFNNHPV